MSWKKKNKNIVNFHSSLPVFSFLQIRNVLSRNVRSDLGSLRWCVAWPRGSGKGSEIWCTREENSTTGTWGLHACIGGSETINENLEDNNRETLFFILLPFQDDSQSDASNHLRPVEAPPQFKAKWDVLKWKRRSVALKKNTGKINYPNENCYKTPRCRPKCFFFSLSQYFLLL